MVFQLKLHSKIQIAMQSVWAFQIQIAIQSVWAFQIQIAMQSVWAFQIQLLTVVHFAMSRMERAGICMPLIVHAECGLYRLASCCLLHLVGAMKYARH
jgi:hypothetical protein